ncbi:MAG TPA: sulfatase [Candidatus Polarisedimenticolia bacterium]|jgi:arylsulfatase A-like enzyme
MSLARTALAVALVTGAAGLVEGILLAVIFDPFGAGAAARALSLAKFVAAYAIAGSVAGAILGWPAELIRRRLDMAPEWPAALVSGLIGIVYARSWTRTIMADVWFSPVVQVSLLIWGLGLFAAMGALASRHRRPGRVAATCLGLMILVGAPGFVPGPPRPLNPHPHVAAPPATIDPNSMTDGPAPPRNVILILADTLRADHLSLYGYERPTSPELSRFARSGVTFTNAIVAKTKTSPSVASLFTGAWPYTHGIVTCRTTLPGDLTTLAEILKARGFSTHSIVANSNVGAAFGFDQGFESVDEIWADPNLSDARGVTDHALSWLKARRDSQPGRPFFLYVHYIDPHAPYSPPLPFSEMFVDDPFSRRHAGIKVGLGDDSIGSIRPSVRLPERATDVGYYISRYDGEIAYLDHHLGRLLASVSEMGLAGDTLVIFTADHGEALSEHEVFFSHGEFSYEDNARVPLMMALPGRLAAGATVSEVIEIAGVAPTVLASLGLPVQREMEVQGFWDLAMGMERPERNVELAAYIEAGTVAGALRTAIRTRRWKLIENPTGFDRTPGRWDLRSALNMNRKQKAFELARTGREHLSRFELYDLETDPAEMRNLDRDHPEVVDELMARLRAWRERGAGRPRLSETPNADLPEEVIRNLRSLGYVN